MKSDKKFIALELRKQGQSYSQISATTGIAKSTLSFWLKDVPLSEDAKEFLAKRIRERGTLALIKRNKEQTILAKERAEKIRLASQEEALTLIESPLFLLGVSLYWAEGYKKGAEGSKWKSVNFTNSDPEMIRIIMRFFREICEVEESSFRIQLIAYQNIDEKRAIDFWSHLTGISRDKFIRTSLPISKGLQIKRKTNILPFGTVHVRINDVKLFFRIIGWIDALKKNF